MENILTYTAVQIKSRFEPPSKLVCNNELAACIGILYALRKQSLPDCMDDLEELAKPFQKEDTEQVADVKQKKLLRMIQEYRIKPSEDLWKGILLECYEHEH